jgi:hypothetical protein
MCYDFCTDFDLFGNKRDILYDIEIYVLSNAAHLYVVQSIHPWHIGIRM